MDSRDLVCSDDLRELKVIPELLNSDGIIAYDHSELNEAIDRTIEVVRTTSCVPLMES
jgi:hypothetical protein